MAIPVTLKDPTGNSTNTLTMYKNSIFTLLGLNLLISVGTCFGQSPSKHPSFNIITQTIASKKLNETRVINISLPDDYQANSKEKYPVIYLLDGGIEEDFVHVAGLVRYNTQPWINRFPKSIVVGIENTNRRRDFSYPVPNLDFLARMGFKKEQYPLYGGSANFISFLEHELQPYINQQYRTTEGKTIIGESFAGLMATEILLKHRKLFDTYIIISPSLWWGNEGLIASAPKDLSTANDQEIKVYIGASNKEEDLIMYNDAVALSETLKKNGGSHMKVSFDYLPDEIHSTIIHQAVYNAFKLLYPHTAYQK